MKTGENPQLICKTPPKGCQFRQGRWIFRTYIQGKQKSITLKDGKFLQRENTPCSKLYKLVEEIQSNREFINYSEMTISTLLNNYLTSGHGKKLSKNTHTGYAYYFKTITNTPLSNGRILGEMPASRVTKGLIRIYYDWRELNGVTTGANREIELLSASFNWACERDYLKENPCKGVRANPEKSKKVYITDTQYYDMLEICKDTPIFYAMEIAYLCRARGIEAWNITLDLIDDSKGVFIQRTKGSLPEWTLWNERLRLVIDQALDLRKKTLIGLSKKGKVIPFTQNLILTKNGEPFSKNARDSAWQRSYKKLVEMKVASLEKEKRFSFHDIKAKGVSDHELNESGHKSEKAKAVYMRKTKEVKPTR